MRKALYILLLFWICWSCKEDKVTFDASIPLENLTFEPVAGGSIMHYKLPANSEIIGIRIRYNDVMGRQIIRTGSYATDTLTLIGFNEGRKGVPATITLCNREDMESEPIVVSFDTKSSGPVAFFEKLNIQPGYAGFQLTYETPARATGLAHVFYVGVNPTTQRLDTIQIKSFQIKPGSETLTFEPKQVLPSYDIIVRTEDFRGYKVKERVWKNIVPFTKKLLEWETDFTFEDPEGLSIEDPVALLGWQYLFDKDFKGETCKELKSTEYKTYLAGPYILGKSLIIIDMLKERHPAEVRLYCMLNMRSDLPENVTTYGPIWMKRYQSKLPCNVSVFASNDKNDDTSWQEISYFEEIRTNAISTRWCARGLIGSNKVILSQEQLLLADPAYMRLGILASDETYRYLKIVVNDLFSSLSLADLNTNQYITIHELEVLTRKEK